MFVRTVHRGDHCGHSYSVGVVLLLQHGCEAVVW
jgi:hypothetical protein